jgi:hypothetical protein
MISLSAKNSKCIRGGKFNSPFLVHLLKIAEPKEFQEQLRQYQQWQKPCQRVQKRL